MRGSDAIFKNTYFNEITLKHYFMPSEVVTKTSVRNISCKILY